MTQMKVVYLVLILLFSACSDQLKYSESADEANFETVLTAKAPVTFDPSSNLTEKPENGNFSLTGHAEGVSILVSSDDYPGVLKVAEHLRQDIGRVTSQRVRVINSLEDVKGQLIVVGSMDQSSLIKGLANSHVTVFEGLAGKWEKFITQVVETPYEGVGEALVIAGSDKRGTIYGMYDLSGELGVSPWYWWADVPVKKRTEVYVKSGQRTMGEPKVKYRGIFINDEAPALAGWVHEKFGGFNHRFYERVYELILRHKGNYLWPAMWGRAIYDDDPVSPQLADLYGVVIGTSHHEPLMRAHVEWSRFGEGPWDYEQNKEKLQAFWREGIQRMGNNESIVSIGMRGDGDEAMTEGTAISLLEEIVKDQRQIISEETGKPAAKTPQIWALYKEVQAYYDKGMRVPDDVTLLLCDDNWGNIRKLPKPGGTLRTGGYGIYYHFDYVGGPRNYKWLNTTQVSRIWEQMNMAYQHGAQQVWIVNVGDIKPMEFPISFFLDYAWDPDAIEASQIPDYGEAWATQQFGSTYATEISALLHKYTQYNSRRKPELLSPETYSLIQNREFERVVSDWKDLVDQVESIGKSLPQDFQSAFFQLVEFPVKACANLNELYYVVAKNRLYADQNRVATNDMANKAQQLFEYDQELAKRYHQLQNGKWNHMMSQTHIGYTYWQQPEYNSIPKTEHYSPQSSAQMGVMVEGSAEWFPNTTGKLQLPAFEYKEDVRFVEIYNRGEDFFSFEITPKDDLLKFSSSSGKITDQQRIEVSVDWEKVHDKRVRTFFTVSGAGETTVLVDLYRPGLSDRVLRDVPVSIEAANYVSSITSGGVGWLEIPQLGLTKSAMTSTPVTHSEIVPGGSSPRLEYELAFESKGTVVVDVVFSPTLNFHNENDGLKYAVSIDDNDPVIKSLHESWTYHDWQRAVSTNRIVSSSTHHIKTSGLHRIKFWMVDSGLCLQKLIVSSEGGQDNTYLGWLTAVE